MATATDEMLETLEKAAKGMTSLAEINRVTSA